MSKNTFAAFHSYDDDVDIPKTTNNPLRKFKKKLREAMKKNKLNPTPELSNKIKSLEEKIHEMEKPQYIKPTKKFKKKKIDKSAIYKERRRKEADRLHRKREEKMNKEMERNRREKEARKRREEKMKKEMERNRREKDARKRREEKRNLALQIEKTIQQYPLDIQNFNINKNKNKSIWKKLCIKYHPDKGGNIECQKMINNIWEYKNK
jgi:hypothetical protein